MPTTFKDRAIKELAERNSAKLHGFIEDYRDYRNQGGKVGQEEFIRSRIADEDGINLATGELQPGYGFAETAGHNGPMPKFNSDICKALFTRAPDRCTELMMQYQDEREHGGQLANKLSIEAYVELHADLEPGQLPWPGSVQDALEKAGK